MIAILTADIINSRAINSKEWLPELKKNLNAYGKEPRQWEIFRGDSFQLETTPSEALEAAIIIKSTIKQFKSLDVRIAIGIGEKSYESKKITESNGSAFIHSGETFELLEKRTLAIKTGKKEIDKTFNLMFVLACLTMDNWTPVSSTLIKNALENKKMNQKQLAEKLNKKQSNVSTGLKRGGFDEIRQLISFYKQKFTEIC